MSITLRTQVPTKVDDGCAGSVLCRGECPGGTRLRSALASWLRLLDLVAIFVMHELCSTADRVRPPNLGHIGHRTVVTCFCLSNTINLG